MDKQYCVTLIYGNNHGIGNWFPDISGAERCIKEAKENSYMAKVNFYEFTYYTKEPNIEVFNRRKLLSVWERAEDGEWVCTLH